MPRMEVEDGQFFGQICLFGLGELNSIFQIASFLILIWKLKQSTGGVTKPSHVPLHRSRDNVPPYPLPEFLP